MKAAAFLFAVIEGLGLACNRPSTAKSGMLRTTYYPDRDLTIVSTDLDERAVGDRTIKVIASYSYKGTVQSKPADDFQLTIKCKPPGKTPPDQAAIAIIINGRTTTFPASVENSNGWRSHAAKLNANGLFLFANAKILTVKLNDLEFVQSPSESKAFSELYAQSKK